MASKVTERDNGHKALMKRLEAAKGAVTVGIHEAEGGEESENSDGLTVIEVANFHEFGAEGTPRRSMIADWHDDTEAQNRADMAKSMEAVVKGTLPSTHNALDRLGQKFVGDVQARIKAGIPPENAESTIAKKGSSTPLIDSGQMWGSIRHQVHDE